MTENRVHLLGGHETACCSRTSSELRSGDTFTGDHMKVTCTVGMAPTLRERLAAAILAEAGPAEPPIVMIQGDPSYYQCRDCLQLADAVLAVLPSEHTIRAAVGTVIVQLSHDIAGNGRRWRKHIPLVDRAVQGLTLGLIQSMGNLKETS